MNNSCILATLAHDYDIKLTCGKLMIKITGGFKTTMSQITEYAGMSLHLSLLSSPVFDIVCSEVGGSSQICDTITHHATNLEPVEKKVD